VALPADAGAGGRRRAGQAARLQFEVIDVVVAERSAALVDVRVNDILAQAGAVADSARV